MKLNPNIKYILGSILSLPLFPILIFDAYKIRKTVPRLPEAKDLEGYEGKDYDKTLNLIAIGESTIAGVGAKSNAEGFTGILAKELSGIYHSNISWKVYAKSGYTVNDVNKNIIPEISEEKVDIIVIGLGANDAFLLNMPFRWKSQLKSLIESLRKRYPQTPIFFNNMPPIKEFPAFSSSMKHTIGNLIEILGETLNELVETYDNVFYQNQIISLKNWMANNEFELRENYFSDGVHPSDSAYRILAKEMATYINSQKQVL